MPSNDSIQRVRMYLTEDDQWEEQPLYIAVLERLQQEGATGATALRGVAGFGPGHRVRTAGFVGVSDHQPIVIEWVDRADRVNQTMPLLDDLLPRALITIEDINVYRAVIRGQTFAGNPSVGHVMNSSPSTVTTQSRLSKVIATMLTNNQATLPVLDAKGHLVGIVSEQQLIQRTGLFLPMRILRLLTEDEGREFIKPFTSLDLQEIMNNEPRSVYVNASIGQALVMMVEWNYEQIPVLDRSGALVGLLSRDDVLRASVEQQADDDDAIRDAEPPPPVRLVMQTSVPHIPITEPLAFALQQMLTTSSHYLVVVDSARRVQGILSDVAVVSHLHGAERATVLSLLQHNKNGKDIKLADLPGTDRSFADMLEHSTAAVAPDETIVDATRRLLELKLEQLPVADEDGRLVGLIARGVLMRALLQANR